MRMGASIVGGVKKGVRASDARRAIRVAGPGHKQRCLGLQELCVPRHARNEGERLERRMVGALWHLHARESFVPRVGADAGAGVGRSVRAGGRLVPRTRGVILFEERPAALNVNASPQGAWRPTQMQGRGPDKTAQQPRAPCPVMGLSGSALPRPALAFNPLRIDNTIPHRARSQRRRRPGCRSCGYIAGRCRWRARAGASPCAHPSSSRPRR
jgi:hypothetical protein